jgi:hypothetical protein
MVSVLVLTNSKSHIPSGLYRKYLPAPSTPFGGYPRPSFGYPQPLFRFPRPSCVYRLPTGSGGVMVSTKNPSGINRTHIEDLKDPNEILLPTRNLVLVVLGEDESEHSTPFTPLADLLLHFYQGPVIEVSVKGSLGARIVVLAHVFRFPIASRTDCLSSSDRFPFNLW